MGSFPHLAKRKEDGERLIKVVQWFSRPVFHEQIKEICILYHIARRLVPFPVFTMVLFLCLLRCLTENLLLHYESYHYLGMASQIALLQKAKFVYSVCSMEEISRIVLEEEIINCFGNAALSTKYCLVELCLAYNTVDMQFSCARNEMLYDGR